MIYLKKFLYALLTIYLAVTTLFFAIRLAPGDPVERIVGEEAKQEDREQYRKQLGLHLPIYQQYFRFLANAFKGDLGESLFKKKDVAKLITIRLGPTLVIAACSVFLAFLLGTTLGLVAGYYHSTNTDKILRIVVLLALAFPIFSLAPVLVYIFSIRLSLFPVSEWKSIWHAVLPILTLVIPLSAVIMRVVRNKYLESKGAPWPSYLVAKGMGALGVQLRLLKICLPTILNIIALQLSIVLAGTMITEQIFDIPGMGSLLFEAIQNRDYPIVQGVLIYSTIVYMIVYFLIDVINSKIDPRIKLI